MASVAAERVDRAVQHDVAERIEVELGGERLAQAPDGRLQARPLERDQIEAMLGLGDARAAIAVDEHDQRCQRQQEEQLSRGVARAVGDQQAERRDAGIDQPHDGDHAELDPRGDPERRRLAHGGGEKVDNAARQERAEVDPSERRAAVDADRERQDQRRAERVQRVGDREQRLLDAGTPGGDPDQRAADQPRGREQRYHARRQQEQHRNQDQVGRNDVAGADRELDRPRDDRVQRHQ